MTPNGARKRHSRQGRREKAAPPQIETKDLAAFAAFEIRPVDPPLWVIQPAMWLQPELAPALPATDLRVQHYEKIPIPGFLGLEAAAVSSAPGGFAVEPVWVAPQPGRRQPSSDLAPLGWDPRAEIRKEGVQ